jgi:hypothetical protein
MTIQGLKNEAAGSEIKVSELLRKAKLILKDSGKQDFLSWVDKELNGYDKGEDVPEYRIIHGEPKGWNPYHGWVPFIIEDPKSQELLSKRGTSQSIAELESLIEHGDKSGYLQMSYPAEARANFSKSVGLDTNFSLFISPSVIHGILNTVRNKLIDGLIEIDTGSDQEGSPSSKGEIIFPDELIAKLPQDIKLLADDFNFNFSNQRPKTCMLTLRRILPLSIVRKYQKDNKENEIKNASGEYLETKALLGKAQSLLSQGRIYTDLASYKTLTDGAQHSYTLNIQTSDVRGAAIALRVFLDDIF